MVCPHAVIRPFLLNAAEEMDAPEAVRNKLIPANIKDQDLKELAVKITKAGINVEKVISNNIPGLVIGQIVECVNHPNSDHMHICQVDVGNDELVQIVCGAPNVKSGIKVIVALDGTKLPGGIIKNTSLRGIDSNGMICALCEIGLEENTKENYAKGQPLQL